MTISTPIFDNVVQLDTTVDFTMEGLTFSGNAVLLDSIYISQYNVSANIRPGQIAIGMPGGIQVTADTLTDADKAIVESFVTLIKSKIKEQLQA